MHENEHGSERQDGAEQRPPEYVSPWGSPRGNAGTGQDSGNPSAFDADGHQDTLSFGRNEQESGGEGLTLPGMSRYGQPGAYGQGGAFGQGGQGEQPGGYGRADQYASYGQAGGYGQPGQGAQSGAGQGAQPGPGGYGQGGYGQGGQPGGYGQGGQPGGYGQGGQPGGYGQGAQPGGYGEAGGFGQGGYGTPGGGYGGWGGTPGGYGEPPRPKRRGRALIYVVVAALAACIGAGTAVALSNSNSNSGTGVSSHDIPQPQNNSASSGSSSSGTALNASAIATKVDPSIVDVTSTIKYQSETAEGTGMILNSKGLILTNNHVIDQATNVRVTLVQTGRTYPATIVGYDATDDVALLQLQGASGLKPISVGNSSQVNLGTQVLALGNAQGKGGLPSTAQGLINAKNRTITASDQGSGATETLHGMFQTNAQIQQGDSGGPLVNSAGQVIGMDTAANTSSSDSFSTSGTVIGFAIPINKALTIANEIASNQASSTVHIGQTPFIGVAVADISKANSCLNSASGSGAGGAGGGYTAPVSSGAVVCQALPGTAAASAGLTAGDVITAVNGQSVASQAGLETITAQFKVGQTVSITYVDSNGAKHTTSLTLTAGPAK